MAFKLGLHVAHGTSHIPAGSTPEQRRACLDVGRCSITPLFAPEVSDQHPGAISSRVSRQPFVGFMHLYQVTGQGMLDIGKMNKVSSSG